MGRRAEPESVPAVSGEVGMGNAEVDDAIEVRERERPPALVPRLVLLVSDEAGVGNFKVVDDAVEVRERERAPALGPGSRSRVRSMGADLSR